MRSAETVTFGGAAGRDRAARLRGDPTGLAALAARPGACRIALRDGEPLAEGPDAAPRLARLPIGPEGPPPLFLGLSGAEGVWAGEGGEAPEGARPADLRSVMARLDPEDAELAATARALSGWHAAHGFCAACGARSVPAQAGWQRDCPACGAHHFPRTDPVVIMLVTRGDRVLLGRNAAWPEGMFSLLAGFVEPGETVEAAVRREVLEESGVAVGPVSYLASQPWPFPASLMLGCRAEALSEAISVDPTEIEAATWVPRARLMRVLAGLDDAMRAPRVGPIAGFLMRAWLADRLN